MQAWPTTVLPDPLLDAQSQTQVTSTLRTGISYAFIQQRRRFPYQYPTQPYQFKMTDYQFCMFQSFRFYKLRRGNNWFTMDLPLEGGIANYRVRMVGGYKATYQDPYWTVEISLEIDREVGT